MSHYNLYGKMASDLSIASINQNGRYHAQQDAERYIPIDVMDKLDLRPDDHFLDIGCGLGTNLIPLSPHVNHAAGCDHPNVIERLKQRSP